MVRDDRVYFHLYPVLVHLARTVGLPIEIVKYIRDEVRASGIRARRALKGHLQAGGIVRYLTVQAFSGFGFIRIDELQRQRSAQWKALRLNWTPREERFWERGNDDRVAEDGYGLYRRVWGARLR